MQKRTRSSADSEDLHGNAPDRCELALLLIDVINDLEFPEGDQVARRARPMAKRLAELKSRAEQAHIPCIYVNDNFGRWRSDFNAQVRHCLSDGVRGQFLCAALTPRKSDYFVLKPKHSGFYQTCLELLLEHLGTKTLLIAGISTESCVTFTANDAFLRGYSMVVLEDGCASGFDELHRHAIRQMQRMLDARIARCKDISFARSRDETVLRVARRRSR
jgi:nicotinamidase-related amidase